MKFALEPSTPGRRIITVAWISLLAVSAASVPFAIGAAWLEITVAATCLSSFVVGLAVWVVAFARALQRTTLGDDVAVSNWVFLSGSAPTPVRTQLLLVAGLTLAVTAATTFANPFVWLANLLPLGLSALWGAKHGTFPPRKVVSRTPPGAPRGRRSK